MRVEIKLWQSKTVLVLDSCGDDTAYPRALGKVLNLIAEAGISPTGPPLGCYPFNDADRTTEQRFQVMLPVAEPIEPPKPLYKDRLPGGLVASLSCGPGEGPRAGDYELLCELIRGSGRRVVGPVYEIYRPTPDNPDDHCTEICLCCEDAAPRK